MDTKRFCQQVSAWIDPFLILEAARRYENDREAALSKSPIVLCSAVIDDANEGAFLELVQEYLDDFTIPEGLVQLLKYPGYSDEAWDWVAQLSFRGQLHTNFGVADNIPEGQKPLLLVVAEDAVVDMLIQPLSNLTYMISKMAEQLKPVLHSVPLSSLFQESSLEGEFAVYVESKVMRAYGIPHAGDAAYVHSNKGPIVLYRAVAMQVESIPVDPQDLQTMKELSRLHASNTLKPVDERNLRNARRI